MCQFIVYKSHTLFLSTLYPDCFWPGPIWCNSPVFAEGLGYFSVCVMHTRYYRESEFLLQYIQLL